MTDDSNKTEPGIITNAVHAVRHVARKFLEVFGGKEAVDLAKQSLTAYGQGHVKEGFHLNHESKVKAGEYQMEGWKALGQSVKDLVSGGAHVSEHDSTPIAPAKLAAKANGIKK